MSIININQVKQRPKNGTLKNTTCDRFRRGYVTVYVNKLTSFTQVTYKPFISNSSNSIIIQFCQKYVMVYDVKSF